MSDDSDERTEAPTERRRAEARRQGNVARSADLTSAGLLLGAAALFALFGPSLIQGPAELLRQALASPPSLNLDADWAARRALMLAAWFGTQALPLLLMMMACVLAVSLLQVGFLFSPEVLAPNLSRVSPLEGAQRIFSVRSLLRVAVNLAKILLAVALAGWAITRLLPEFLALAALDTASESSRNPGTASVILETIRRTGVRFAFALAGGLLILSVFDYALQRWIHERSLRMSRQDLRDELRHAERPRVTRPTDKARQPILSQRD